MTDMDTAAKFQAQLEAVLRDDVRKYRVLLVVCLALLLAAYGALKLLPVSDKLMLIALQLLPAVLFFYGGIAWMRMRDAQRRLVVIEQTRGR